MPSCAVSHLLPPPLRRACPPAEKPKQGAKRAADGKKKAESSEEEEESSEEEVGGCGASLVGWLAGWLAGCVGCVGGICRKGADPPPKALLAPHHTHVSNQAPAPFPASSRIPRIPPLPQEEEEEEEKKPAAKKQKAADGSAVDVSAANGSRTIFMKNLAWAADEVREGSSSQCSAVLAAASQCGWVGGCTRS